jgi:dTDP-glucose 4,6-dehydratase
MTAYGAGTQTRSLLYIDDLVRGLQLLLAKAYHLPVNIGGPQEMTVLEIAEKIRTLTQTKSEVVFHPLPEDDPQVRQPDTTKAKELLGWEPKVPLETGLAATIAYFRQALAIAK